MIEADAEEVAAHEAFLKKMQDESGEAPVWEATENWQSNAV